MALRFAILTALSERPSSGFELARRFDRAFGYFWSASHQQIYRELDRLHGGGLVVETPAPDESGRGQPKRFAITPGGTAALRAWVGEVDEPTPIRETVMVRLRAAAAVGDLDGARDVLAHHLDVHERSRATYRDIEARHFAPDRPAERTDTDALQYLVLRGGLMLERAWVDWCREALDELDARRAVKPTGRPAPGSPSGHPAG
ncbi:MAG TPA: helix-turn-helix transcriptional regulator [Pseudonocardia sp.]|jgi:DNA-binding PadR family transcriptional regulator